MKAISRLIFLLLATGFVRADDAQTLAAVAKKLSAQTHLDRHFVQTKHLAILKRPIRTEGTLLYRDTQGLCWATDTPVKSLLVLDGDSIRQINAASSSTISAAQQPALFGFTQLFFAALSGRIEPLRERFSIAVHGDENQWRLQLVPNDAMLKKFIAQMDLHGGAQLDRVSLRGIDSDITEIEFSEPRSTGNSASNGTGNSASNGNGAGIGASNSASAELEQRCFATP